MPLSWTISRGEESTVVQITQQMERKGKLTRKVTRSPDESTHRNEIFRRSQMPFSIRKEERHSFQVIMCTFIQRSCHFSGEFSIY